MLQIDQWFDRPLDRRAPQGGERGCDGVMRRGGEFEPFYVPRPVMPQVDEKDLPALLRFASARGVVVRLERRAPDTLKFHQRVSAFHVRQMDAATMAKPVLASGDGFILDGNHRLAAHKRDGSELDVITLELDFEAAIALLFQFPATYAYGDGAEHPISH